MKRSLLLKLCLVGLVPLAAPAETVRVESGAGIAAQLDTATGHYEIIVKQPAWTFAGDLGGPARAAGTAAGKDRLGGYHEIHFRWSTGGPLSGSVRVYDTRPVVLFTFTCEEAAGTPPAPFPRFTSVPRGLHQFSHKNKVFAPPTFTLESTGTPWIPA